MATTKSTALTNAESENHILTRNRLANGALRIGKDREALLAAELDSGDVILYNITMPSNAIVDSIAVVNDDIDGATSAVLDIGLAATCRFTSVTSGTETDHSKDDVLDSNVLVDGATTLQGATTNWTALDPNFGPEKFEKELWELLGYDKDPVTSFRVAVVIETAPGTPQAGDLAVKVEYTAN